MKSYIKKLQSKDENSRKQILIISLVVSMTLVGSVWIYNLVDRFSDEKVATASTDESVGPFKLFADSVKDAYDNIAASVGKISLKDNLNQEEKKQIDLIPVEDQTIK